MQPQFKLPRARSSWNDLIYFGVGCCLALILYFVSEIIAIPFCLNKNYFCLWQESASTHGDHFRGLGELSDYLRDGQAAEK